MGQKGFSVHVLYKPLQEVGSTRCVQRSYLWRRLQHISAQHVNVFHTTAGIHGRHEIKQNIKEDG